MATERETDRIVAYRVHFHADSTIRLAPSLTGLDETFELGNGYYVQKVEGVPGDFKLELVEGPYTPRLAAARADELNLRVGR